MKTSDYDAGGKIEEEEEEALENDKEESWCSRHRQELYADLHRSALKVGQLISKLGDEKALTIIECGINAGIEQTKTTSKQ